MANNAVRRPWRPGLSRLQRVREKLIELALLACGLLSIFITLAIGLVLVHNAVSFFIYEDIDFEARAASTLDAQTVAMMATPLGTPLVLAPEMTVTLRVPTPQDAEGYVDKNFKRLRALQQQRAGLLIREAIEAYDREQKQFEFHWTFASALAAIERHIPVYSAFRYPPSGTRERMSGEQIWERFDYFFRGDTWFPVGDNPRFGILPLITGTVMVMLIAAAISLPLGLLTAIYLSEYAGARVRAIAKPTLELLAGIPTIVYGYFALMTVTPLLQSVIPSLQFYNQLSGGIVVGIMIIPMVASLSEDSLRAVPRTLRDGAIALGANKFETSVKVVVPAALSGITASFLLAIARAVGETMAVSLACGQEAKMLIRFLSGGELLAFQANEGGLTMTSAIVNVAKGDLPHGTAVFDSIFAVAMVLFFVTLVMNVIAQMVLRRYRQVYQ